MKICFVKDEDLAGLSHFASRDLEFVVAGRDVVAEMGGVAHVMVISIYLDGFSELGHTIWRAPLSPGPRFSPIGAGPCHPLTS